MNLTEFVDNYKIFTEVYNKINKTKEEVVKIVELTNYTTYFVFLFSWFSPLLLLNLESINFLLFTEHLSLILCCMLFNMGLFLSFDHYKKKTYFEKFNKEHKLFHSISTEHLKFHNQDTGKSIKKYLDKTYTEEEKDMFVKISEVNVLLLAEYMSRFPTYEEETGEAKNNRRIEYKKKYSFSIKHVLLFLIERSNKEDLSKINAPLISIITDEFNNTDILKITKLMKKIVSTDDEVSKEIINNIKEINNIVEGKKTIIKSNAIKSI